MAKNWISHNSWKFLTLACACCAALATSARAEPSQHADPREQALMRYRLQELALLAHREAYVAHALTLADEPAKARIAWGFVGLVELQARDFAAASKSFRSCREPLSTDVSASDAKLQETLVDVQRVAALWSERLSSLKERPIETDELLRPAHKLRASDVVLTLGGARKSDAAATEDDDAVTYQFQDPALMVIRNRDAIVDSLQDFEGSPELLSAWRGLLLNDNPTVQSALDSAREQFADYQSEEPVALEWNCLALSYALRANDADLAERQFRRVATAPWLPLWGLRALALAPGNSPRVLAIGQQAIRGLIGDQHPFDGQLLFPQERGRIDRSEYLRACYWEVGALHGQRGTSSSGLWLTHPVNEHFVRAARLSSELNSPLRRGTRPITDLRRVMLALASARAGDFESWQDAAAMRQVPLWDGVLVAARSVAGDRRTRSSGALLDRSSEVQVELPEHLLLGDGKMPEDSSPADPPDQPQQVAERSNLWIWSLIGVIVVALLIVGIAKRSRRPSSTADG